MKKPETKTTVETSREALDVFNTVAAPVWESESYEDLVALRVWSVWSMGEPVALVHDWVKGV